MAEQFESAEKPRISLYKDTITGLNREYDVLLNLFLIGDCRVVYLKKFEMWLSLNCPEYPLWVNERYIRLSTKYPLPQNPEAYVSRKLFYLYLMLYEMVMRDIGLIGRKKEQSKSPAVFDMAE